MDGSHGTRLPFAPLWCQLIYLAVLYLGISVCLLLAELLRLYKASPNMLSVTNWCSFHCTSVCYSFESIKKSVILLLNGNRTNRILNWEALEVLQLTCAMKWKIITAKRVFIHSARLFLLYLTSRDKYISLWTMSCTRLAMALVALQLEP